MQKHTCVCVCWCRCRCIGSWTLFFHWTPVTGPQPCPAPANWALATGTPVNHRPVAWLELWREPSSSRPAALLYCRSRWYLTLMATLNAPQAGDGGRKVSWSGAVYISLAKNSSTGSLHIDVDVWLLARCCGICQQAEELRPNVSLQHLWQINNQHSQCVGDWLKIIGYLFNNGTLCWQIHSWRSKCKFALPIHFYWPYSNSSCTRSFGVHVLYVISPQYKKQRANSCMSCVVHY